MSKMTKVLVSIVAVLFCCFQFPADVSADESVKYSTSPRTNNGIKWRLAYYQGGAYDGYYYYLSTTIKGFMKLGWIETEALPDSSDRDSRALWKWLVQDVQSDYLEFVEDGFYSAAWDDSVRQLVRNDVINRLSKRKDIDLVLAMGTWAGQDLATNEHSVPTIIVTSNNPIRSGAIRSIEDSGYDHVNARVDPSANERQIDFFHQTTGFKKLGVAYENTVAGRTYAAIDSVRTVASKQGFEVVECYTQSDIPDLELAGETVISCFEEFAGKVDAIYVTQQGGVNRNTIPKLVALANSHRIPTLSNIGERGVRYGFLLSISTYYGSEASGIFFASNVAKVFNGAKPRSLSQVLVESPRIAINLKTAELVGLYLYADVLAAADQVFPTIATPE